MIITYYGASCFRVQSGDIVLAFDPPSKKSGFKSPRFQADVVLISHQHSNHNGFENITSKDKETPPVLISGPGEYEVKKTPITGIRTFHDIVQGKKYGLNTVYVLILEDTRICHLGDFGEKELRPESQEAMGGVDILFVPISGSVNDVDAAVKITNQIEPKIIIPMHYFSKDFKIDKKRLSEFLKAMGQEKVSGIEKISLRKKEVVEKNSEIVVLTPSVN